MGDRRPSGIQFGIVVAVLTVLLLVTMGPVGGLLAANPAPANSSDAAGVVGVVGTSVPSGPYAETEPGASGPAADAAPGPHDPWAPTPPPAGAPDSQAVPVQLAAAIGPLGKTGTPGQANQPTGQAGPTGQVGTVTIRASRIALADLPGEFLAYYVATAQRLGRSCAGLTWQLLAGIGKVETDHGRSSAPGVKSGVNRFGCCSGPMQFNVRNGGGGPSTWDAYKTDGNGDGKTVVFDPADAIPAAATKLCRDGLDPGSPAGRSWKGVAGADPCPQVRGTPAEHRAIRRYNNACWYAHEVETLAARYTSDRPGPTVSGPQDPFVRALAANPRITTTASHGCDPGPDLASGNLDLRVQALLSALAEHWTVRVSCAHAGHSRFVKGTRRVSNHTVWRAVDLDQVNSRSVSAGNGDAHALVTWVRAVDGPLRPSEVGSPFAEYDPEPVFFTNAGHLEHVHIGYGAQTGGP